MKLALFTAAGQKGNSGQLSKQLCGIYTTLSCHQRTDANTTTPWVIIHLGTILCIHRTDVVHWFRSLSGTCQSITSAIWAPWCTNNSPQGRMRKRREEREEGRRQKEWIHLPETSSFFFLEKNLLFRQLMFIWAESFFIPAGGYITRLVLVMTHSG